MVFRGVKTADFYLSFQGKAAVTQTVGSRILRAAADIYTISILYMAGFRIRDAEGRPFTWFGGVLFSLVFVFLSFRQNAFFDL